MITTEPTRNTVGLNTTRKILTADGTGTIPRVELGAEEPSLGNFVVSNRFNPESLITILGLREERGGQVCLNRRP